jgi:hypothetical protein
LTEIVVTDEQRKTFAENPETYLKFRKAIEADGNSVYESNIKESAMQKMFVEIFTASTIEKVAKKPEILASMSPSFGVGCRRLTPGPGYLEALTEDNVDFISDRIASINPGGIALENGKQVDVDILVCATGFNTTAVPPFDIIGKNGLTLKQKFDPYPQTYFTVAVDDFPNYFMVLGPNAGVGAGSLTVLLESQGDYVVKCIRKLQKEDYVTMMPKPRIVKDFSDYVGEYFKRTVYMDDCKSWYKIGRGLGDRISGLWPGSLLQTVELFRSPRWEDFDYESRHENGLKWIGNGWSTSLMEGGDAAYYLDSEFVDIPVEGTPEADARYRSRPFSH